MNVSCWVQSNDPVFPKDPQKCQMSSFFNGGSVKPDWITSLSWEKSNHESIQGWIRTSKNTWHWQNNWGIISFYSCFFLSVDGHPDAVKCIASKTSSFLYAVFVFNKCKLKPKIWYWWGQKHCEWWEKVAENADKTNTLNIHLLLTYLSSNAELFVISALKNRVY